MPPDGIRALVADELARPVDPRVSALAAQVAARHGHASRAVLFYGSCLRETILDGRMLDFYLIVSGYRAAYATRWEAIANRLLPPNVYPIGEGGLAAKYAVLSVADFHRLCGAQADNPAVWARFAQPSRLAWAADEDAERAAVAAVAQAAPTLLARARTACGGAEGLDLWRRAFALTYASELRAERGGRAADVVDADPERYRRFTGPALAAAPALPSHDGQRRWRATQRRGKLLTLARLAKASATFAGGIDYLAWKIERHSGAAITLRPWQRRWPLVGAFTLLPRLLARGAVR